MEKDKKQKLIIIDGNAIVHRAYHALPPMRVKDGTIVNAVYGFTSMLLKIIHDIKPEYLAVSFDVAGGTFRDEVYEDYKATRVEADQDLYDQFPLVYELVESFDIPIFKKTGFEADDVIATITEQVKLKHDDVRSLILTGDKDLLQLVDDKHNVEVVMFKKGMSEFQEYDEAHVTAKMGFGPEFVVTYKSLCGDSSDNIPGVKGIGNKTAIDLITKIGSVDEIYKQLKKENSTLRTEFKVGVINKLETDEDQAFMSKELATVRRDVTGIKFDLQKAKTRDFDRENVVKLFQKFEFYSLINRLPGNSEDKYVSEEKTAKKKKNKTIKKLTLVNNENFDKSLSALKKEPVMAVKEILSEGDVLNATLNGLVFVCSSGNYYFENVDKKVLALFQDENKVLLGHDIKSLVKVLQLKKQEIKNTLFDTMVASYLLNSSTRAHDLKSIALRELGQEVNLSDNQGSLFGVDPQIIAEELKISFAVYNDYNKKIETEKYHELFYTIEMALIPVLAEMELSGVFVDTKELTSLSEKVNKEIKKLEQHIWDEAGEEFNVASSVQLREILFEKMELPTDDIKKGKTGYSTAASELEKLRDMHPIIEHIEKFRELEKLRNTYIDVLPTLINKKTGRIHTSFNQTVASTGRLSSSDPNLQNIPIRTELGKKVREVFIAEPGNKLIVADYSQIELRVVASLAKDDKMIEVFKKGQDIHSATAALINGVKLAEVTKEMRRAAKEVNFGVLYGMGAFGLASRTGISHFEAQDFINRYFDSFQSVKKYMDDILKQAKKTGYAETMFGRRRYIPELNAKNMQMKRAGERMAINMPVQGTAADIMKLAMIAVYSKIKEDKDIKLILQIHDEIVLEVPDKKADDISKLVKTTMERVVELLVPIDVNVGIVDSWGKAK